LVLVLMAAAYGMQVLFTWLRWLNQKAPDEVKESWGPVARLGRWGLMAVFLLALAPAIVWPCVAMAAEVFPAAQLDRIQYRMLGSHSIEVTLMALFLASLFPMILAHPLGISDD